MTKKTPLKLYTKTGDTGESNVLNGVRLAKDHDIFEVLGTLDELNSSLGLAIVCVTDKDLRKELLQVQDALLNFGAIVAGSKAIDPTITNINLLEKRIDYYQANTREDWYTTFLLPGGIELAARIDLSRTICRRLERRMATLTISFDSASESTAGFPNQLIQAEISQVQAYINRLSDYLFALRCYLNSQADFEEITYHPKFLDKPTDK